MAIPGYLHVGGDIMVTGEHALVTLYCPQVILHVVAWPRMAAGSRLRSRRLASTLTLDQAPMMICQWCASPSIVCLGGDFPIAFLVHVYAYQGVVSVRFCF